MINALLAQAGVLNIAAGIEHAEAVVMLEHSDVGAARGLGNDIVVVGKTDNIVHGSIMGPRNINGSHEKGGYETVSYQHNKLLSTVIIDGLQGCAVPTIEVPSDTYC